MAVEVLGFLRKDVPAEWTRLVEACTTADVFCFPTRYEPFGIALLEAMLFGLPVVSSRAWAIPEIVVEDETGFTVTLDDREALRASLIALLATPRARGAWARRGAQERWSTSPGMSSPGACSRR